MGTENTSNVAVTSNRVFPSYEELSDEQLSEQIDKVTRIVFSNNPNLARQAYPKLIQLKELQNIRAAKMFEAHLANSGVKLNEIIDIG